MKIYNYFNCILNNLLFFTKCRKDKGHKYTYMELCTLMFTQFNAHRLNLILWLLSILQKKIQYF